MNAVHGQGPGGQQSQAVQVADRRRRGRRPGAVPSSPGLVDLAEGAEPGPQELQLFRGLRHMEREAASMDKLRRQTQEQLAADRMRAVGRRENRQADGLRIPC